MSGKGDLEMGAVKLQRFVSQKDGVRLFQGIGRENTFAADPLPLGLRGRREMFERSGRDPAFALDRTNEL